MRTDKPTISELSRMLGAIQKKISSLDPERSIEELVDIGLSFSSLDGKDCIILLLGMMAARALQMSVSGKSAYEQIMTEVAARARYNPDEFDDVCKLMTLGIERYTLCMDAWQHQHSKAQVELMKKHFREDKAEASDGVPNA